MNNEKGGGPQFEAPAFRPEKGDDFAERSSEDEASSAAESAPGNQTPATLKSPPKTTSVSDIKVKVAKPPQQDDDQSLTPASMMTADDSDLIEKQWVERAKSIVEKTQDDPYIQKKEMSKVKADYIHKRFKKVVKTDEPATK